MCRRLFQIQRSTPVVLPRPAIDNKIETALSGNLAGVLILPGSFQSGKSTWLLDFHQRNRRTTAYHPFYEDDAELQREPYFVKSIAMQLAALTEVSSVSTSAREVDSCVKLGEFIAALGSMLNGRDVLILLYGIDQSGALLDRIMTLLRQYLQSDTRPLRWVLTVRAPSPALLALRGLPCSSVIPSFDDESCALEFIQSYLAAASCDCPKPGDLASEVYEQAGSNIILMRRVVRCIQEAIDAG